MIIFILSDVLVSNTRVLYYYLMPVIIVINILDNNPADKSGEESRQVVVIQNPYYCQKNDAHDPVMQVDTPLSKIQKNRVNFAIINKKMTEYFANNIPDYYPPRKGKGVAKRSNQHYCR